VKCLHIINSLAGGGAEKLLVELLPVIKKLGVNIDLLVFCNKEQSTYSSALDAAAIKIIRINASSVYNPFVVFKLRSIIKRYDVLHVHLFPAQLWVAIASRGLRVKLITTEHRATNKRRTIFLGKYVDRFYYSFYSVIVNVSNDTMKSTIKWLGKKFESKNIEISNGINLDFYQKTKAIERSTLKLNLHNDDKIVVMIASFTEQKDQSTLIKAIHLLSDKYKLLLLGVGSKQQECISLAQMLGITNRVFFLGFQSNIAGLLKMCDIFVLSSLCEGMPLSIIEAMACSLPVIGSNVNGIKELIWDCGILFEQGNEKDLAQKIKALENVVYYNEVAEKCKKLSSKYDILETAKKYINLYI